MDTRLNINELLVSTPYPMAFQTKHVFWQPWLNKDDSSKQTSTKQLPTTKWKRDRRRLPEYSRKSDPKLSENTPPELLQIPSSPVDNPNRTLFSNGDTKDSDSSKHSQNTDAPIDMSVRQRGLPPSYTQAINSPGYRTSFRPSVITQAPATPQDVRMGVRADLPSGFSMCDPIIDEHFRRSLGKDYVMLFNNNKNSEQVTQKPPEKVANTSVRELIDIDTTGLSVDDHFAKALGDTWIKLNQKESEIKTSNGSAEKTTVVSL